MWKIPRDSNRVPMEKYSMTSSIHVVLNKRWDIIVFGDYGLIYKNTVVIFETYNM